MDVTNESMIKTIHEYAHNPFEFVIEGTNDVEQFLQHVDFSNLTRIIIHSSKNEDWKLLESCIICMMKVCDSSIFISTIQVLPNLMEHVDILKYLISLLSTTTQLPSQLRSKVSDNIIKLLFNIHLIIAMVPNNEELSLSTTLSAMFSFLIQFLSSSLSEANHCIKCLLHNATHLTTCSWKMKKIFFQSLSPIVIGRYEEMMVEENVSQKSTIQLRFVELALKICTLSKDHWEQGEIECHLVSSILRHILDYDGEDEEEEDVLFLCNLYELFSQHLTRIKGGRDFLICHVSPNLIRYLGVGEEEKDEEEEEMDPFLGIVSLEILTSILVNEYGSSSSSSTNSLPNYDDDESSTIESKSGLQQQPSSSHLYQFLRAISKFLNKDASTTSSHSISTLKLSSYSALSSICSSNIKFLDMILKTNNLGSDQMMNSSSSSWNDVLVSWLTINRGDAILNAALLHSIAQVLEADLLNLRGDENPQTDGMEEENEEDEMKEERDSSSSELSWDLKRLLFESLGPINGERTTMDLLIPFISQSSRVTELKAGTYHLLRALVIQYGIWGISTFISSSLPTTFEVIEFLSNRDTEFDKSGKEWKFLLIEAIHNSPYKEQILNEEMTQTIQTLVDQGPFYKPKFDPEVDTMA